MDDLEETRSASTGFDPTLPGRRRYWGRPHPVLAFIRHIERILLGMGFSIEAGPEVETVYYNDTVLNSDPEAVGGWDEDPFRIDDEHILRTRVLPALIRVIRKKTPPFRIAAAGRIFRRIPSVRDNLPVGFRVAALMVDESVSFAHLKGVLESFLRALFPESLAIHIRPRYLSYAAPALEVRIECPTCREGENECPYCGGERRISLARAGMVSPQVFKNVNIDPEKFTGFFFEMSIDRAAELHYGVPDRRFFYENEIKFNRNFPSP